MGIVVKRSDIKEIAKKIKSENKKIVFTNGCFDILHIGHSRYLKESAKLGDVLIVGLNSDSSVKKLKGENRPINPQDDRAELLADFSFVDYVVIFDENTPSKLIEEIKPDIYTKGADYKGKTFEEAQIAQKNGGKVEFIEFVDGKSTTNIIKKMANK